MKKLILLFSSIFLVLIACHKEELIKHDSRIFLNNNEGIIGTWEYIFTVSGGGFINVWNKTVQDLPDLRISPNGEYEKFIGNIVVSRGVIDTVKTIQSILYVKFYPNGIKTSIDESPSLRNQNSDTLIISTSSGDTFRSEYYKRN